MKRIVIARKNLPSYWPINHTLVIFLLWDRFHPAEWVTTLLCVYLGIVWLLALISICTEEQVPLGKSDCH